MTNITMSIPHNLSRDEAKRRLQEAIARARHQYASILGELSERWDGDRLTFVLGAAGQSVSGNLFVEDHAVRLEATLPWLLAMLAGPLQRRIEQQGRGALEDRSASSVSSEPPRAERRPG